MKVLIVLSVLIAMAAAASKEVELLQSFDIEALFKNEELRNKGFDCLLDKADCGDLKPIKDATIFVIKNKCHDCNAEQRAKYDKAMKQFQEQFEDVYNAALKKIESGN